MELFLITIAALLVGFGLGAHIGYSKGYFEGHGEGWNDMKAILKAEGNLMKKTVQVDVLKHLQEAKNHTDNQAAKAILENTIRFIAQK
ncbi:hypothetical protein AB1K32_15230 [Metabacillus dongyingensis]|uniref:hypothetical protein n=1 Tax=Metabacillus dongyingensis TaxID=2874282 RepID=UPI003B8AF2D8